MKEISVILPIYNSEKYIKKCLDSIVNQLNFIYELIIINDGSTDNSINIIKKYQEKYENIKLYNIKNEGISNARNYGIDKVKSKYFIFVDSDDYISEELIQKLSNHLKEDYDLIRYQAIMVNDINVEREFDTKFYGKYNGIELLNAFCESDEIFGPPWLYCYKKKVFEKNKLSYAYGRIQEDFGLTPLILSKSEKVLSINYVGYYYYKSTNSIMRNDNYNNTLKKFFDVLYHYEFLLLEFKKEKLDSENIINYLKKVVYLKYKKLTKEDQKKYKNLIDEKNRGNI